MKCPCCSGTGGDYEMVLYPGMGGGPYYQCGYCHGDGMVNIIRWLRWKLAEHKWMGGKR